MSDDFCNANEGSENNFEFYECQNAGCISERLFSAAPKSWFEEKGLTPPKNCPECRGWNEAQKNMGPIMGTCHFCRYIWPIQASYRIIYHKTVGNWDEYWKANAEMQICRRCEEFPGRRRKLSYLDARKKYRENPEKLDVIMRDRVREHQDKDQLLVYLKDNCLYAPSSRYAVPDSALFYAGIATPAHLIERHGKNQLEHILKQNHQWLEKLGTQDPHSVLSIGHRIAVSTEPHIKQFTDGKLIVKYDTEQRTAVFIRRSSESPTGFLIHTAFQKEPQAVLKKIKTGEWQSY